MMRTRARSAVPVVRTPLSRCPGCQREVNAIGAEPGATPPEPGDTSICIYCLSILIFNEDMTIRLVTQAELDSLDPICKSELRRATAMLKRLHGAQRSD